MISHTFRKFAVIIVIMYSSAVVGVSSEEEFETIFLRVYNGTTINDYIDYSLKNNVSEIMSGIDNSKPTVIYIHGYSESVENTSVHTVVNAYLEKRANGYKVNIVAVDYSDLAKLYVDAVNNAPEVGEILAKVLNDMKESGFDTETLHVIGHSLGCQVSGFLGRNATSTYNFRIPRITGLDPAGYMYNSYLALLLPDLSSSDADFVDIIHTDYGYYGVDKPTGTVNFFPNCGVRVQRGCPQELDVCDVPSDDHCSHQRSWEFYAESVINESAFLAVECCAPFLCNKCNNNTQIINMGFATPSNASGIFSLVTNNQGPFGLGTQGAKSTYCFPIILIE